jgi:hypothetical protein
MFNITYLIVTIYDVIYLSNIVNKIDINLVNQQIAVRLNIDK